MALLASSCAVRLASRPPSRAELWPADTRLFLVELRLVPARINREKEYPLSSPTGPIGNALLDMTGHARTDLDRFDRFRAAGELAPFGHVFLRYRGYGYRGWSRLSRGRGFSMLVASR